MNATHTPGPWHLTTDIRGKELLASIRDGGDNIIAQMILNSQTDVANSRLLVAVPDLLRELQDLVDLLERREAYTARAAIAKATGETA